jgi:hypothetical protein
VTDSIDLPEIGDLVADGRLRPSRPDATVLREVIDAAGRDLEAARSNKGAFPAWSETMLYEAGLRCARVIVQAAGYRVAADRGHVTAIDAADALTAGRHHRRFVRLHRMRRWRHEFMYGTNPDPSPGDLEQAERDVLALLRVARATVRDLE